jgi:hypothetical protein
VVLVEEFVERASGDADLQRLPKAVLSPEVIYLLTPCPKRQYLQRGKAQRALEASGAPVSKRHRLRTRHVLHTIAAKVAIDLFSHAVPAKSLCTLETEVQLFEVVFLPAGAQEVNERRLVVCEAIHIFRYIITDQSK